MVRTTYPLATVSGVGASYIPNGGTTQRNTKKWGIRTYKKVVTIAPRISYVIGDARRPNPWSQYLTGKLAGAIATIRVGYAAVGTRQNQRGNLLAGTGFKRSGHKTIIGTNFSTRKRRVKNEVPGTPMSQ